MNDSSPSPASRSLTVPALILGVAIVLGSGMIALQRREDSSLLNKNITVNGIATKNIKADTLKWSFALSKQGSSTSTRTSLQNDLDRDVETIKQRLASAGVTHPSVSRQPVNFIEGYCDRGYGYGYGMSEGSPASEPAPPTQIPPRYCDPSRMTQIIVIDTQEAEKANSVTASIVRELRDSGVQVNDERSEFSLQDDKALRQELLELAQKDAKKKAEVIGGGRSGRLMRVLNETLVIAPVGVRDGGYYGYDYQDNSSLEKKATLTLPVVFSLR